jgi:cytochrome c553
MYQRLAALAGLWGAAASVCFLMIAFAIAEQVKGDRALGEYLSAECVTCHQLSGQFKGIPPIVGWPEASFVEIMKEYRHKKRPNPVMQMIAGRLSEEEIASLAVYFGSLKPSH